MPAWCGNITRRPLGLRCSNLSGGPVRWWRRYVADRPIRLGRADLPGFLGFEVIGHVVTGIGRSIARCHRTGLTGMREFG